MKIKLRNCPLSTCVIRLATTVARMIGLRGSGCSMCHKSSPPLASSSSGRSTGVWKQRQLRDTIKNQQNFLKLSLLFDAVSNPSKKYGQLPQTRWENPAGTERYRQQAQDPLHQSDMCLQLRVRHSECELKAHKAGYKIFCRYECWCTPLQSVREARLHVQIVVIASWIGQSFIHTWATVHGETRIMSIWCVFKDVDLKITGNVTMAAASYRIAISLNCKVL